MRQNHMTIDKVGKIRYGFDGLFGGGCFMWMQLRNDGGGDITIKQQPDGSYNVEVGYDEKSGLHNITANGVRIATPFCR